MVCALLCNWASDGRSLHLTLVVDNNTSVVFEENEDTITSTDGLSLTDDHTWHDLLSEFWLTLLDGCHEHVTDTSSRETIQSTLDVVDGNDVKVLCTRVVCTIHDGSDRA